MPSVPVKRSRLASWLLAEGCSYPQEESPFLTDADVHLWDPFPLLQGSRRALLMTVVLS